VRVALLLGMALAGALVLESISTYREVRDEIVPRSSPARLNTRELLRSLKVATATSVALLGAMVGVLVALPGYVRGRELERQVAIALQVQRDMLSQDLKPGPGVELGTIFEPVCEVGGDLFDVFPAADGNTALALGDVAGKGLPASLLLALLHGLLRSSAGELSSQDLAPLVSRLNSLLCEATPPDRFATLLCRRRRGTGTPPELGQRRPHAGFVGQAGQGRAMHRATTLNRTCRGRVPVRELPV
jgi:hypothetical protein